VKSSFQHFLKLINKTQKRAEQRIAKLREEDIHIFDYQDDPPQIIAIDGSNRWIWNNPDLNARIALVRTAYVIYQLNITTCLYFCTNYGLSSRTSTQNTAFKGVDF